MVNDLKKWFPDDILRKYEIISYNHAAEILFDAFNDEYNEIIDALRIFEVSKEDILKSGGNESPIPPKFAAILEPKGWKEIRISGDLHIKFYPRKGTSKGKFAVTHTEEKVLENYIDGHNIDYVKGRVALDVEWNSKDQTFDRDLYAMRTYYECDVISVGIIITRSEELNSIFERLNVKSKYGASTTWMGKLIPRLDSRRHGGCPILAIGIKSNSVTE